MSSQRPCAGVNAGDAEAEVAPVHVGETGVAEVAREGALVTKHPLLIQKTLADKLSDKVQVIWGTNIVVKEAMAQFRDFLRSFTMGHRRLSGIDDLDGEDEDGEGARRGLQPTLGTATTAVVNASLTINLLFIASPQKFDLCSINFRARVHARPIGRLPAWHRETHPGHPLQASVPSDC